MPEPTNTEIMNAITALGERIERRLTALENKVDANTCGIAELRGEVRQMSVRISDVNARLPVSIAHSPPEPKRTVAG